jgi:hypothetical protein
MRRRSYVDGWAKVFFNQTVDNVGIADLAS